LPNDLEELLVTEEKRLKASLTSQAAQAALFPLKTNAAFHELVRVSRAKALLARYSFLRTNRWFFLAVMLSSLGVAVLSLIHPQAGQISLNAISNSIELRIAPGAEIGDLADLFPDFRTTSIVGVEAARDYRDRPLLPGNGKQKILTVVPGGRLSRISAPSGATLAISDCGLSTCALTLSGNAITILVSVQAAKFCAGPRPQDRCSGPLYKNVAIELAQEATLTLQRLDPKSGDRDGSTLRPIMIVQGTISRMSFDRREGRNGLPTGRFNTLSRGILTFHDFGPEATVRLLYRELGIVGAVGVVEIGLRSQLIETIFVGDATDARTVIKSSKNETLVPSMLQWLIGNKTVAMLFLAGSSGVAFLLTIVRRATGKEKL
jgi:hypothetical protein